MTVFERGILAWSVCRWSRSISGDRKSALRQRWGFAVSEGLRSTIECKVFGGISHGEPVWKSLSVTHSDGWKPLVKGLQIDNAFSVLKCVRPGADVTSFTSVAISR